MNTKKLIGTIIGVLLFVLLIVGATFAWMTLAVNVTQGNYSGTTKNFVINYTGGSEITGLKQISSGNALTSSITSEANASATTDGWVQVTAGKGTTAPKASAFNIKLSITSNTLSSNALMYAVCHGACPTTGALAEPANNDKGATCLTGVLDCGVVTGGSITEKILATDSETFNVDGTVSTQTYNIYFWLDSTTMNDGDIGASFSGKVIASAIQGE